MNLREEIRIALREVRDTGQTLPEHIFRAKIDAIICATEDAETEFEEEARLREDAASWEDTI